MTSLLIIGAGFAGAASAYFLSQIPRVQIRLVEKEENFGVHASGRNAAMLRQAVSDLQTARWIQETLAFLQNPPPEWGSPILFQKTGSLLMGDPIRLRGLFNTLEAAGGRARWASPRNLPGHPPPWLGSVFSADAGGEGLYCPDDGVIHLRNFLGNLLSGAERRGAEIFYRNEVTAIHRRDDFWEVSHGGKIFRADGIINGAGAWCDSLIGMAGLPQLHLISYRRHLFKSRAWNFPNRGLPLVWDVSREVYFRPDKNELLLSPGDEAPHPPADPQVDPGAEQWLRQKLTMAFPGLPPPSLQEAWACLRTRGENGSMYIAQLNERPGYFCVGGLGGHGVGASIGVGKEILDIITCWLKGKIV